MLFMYIVFVVISALQFQIKRRYKRVKGCKSIITENLDGSAWLMIVKRSVKMAPQGIDTQYIPSLECAGFKTCRKKFHSFVLLIATITKCI